MMKQRLARPLALVAMDFDGTIHTMSDNSVAKPVLDALKRIQASPLVSASVITGRCMRSFLRSFDSSVVDVGIKQNPAAAAKSIGSLSVMVRSSSDTVVDITEDPEWQARRRSWLPVDRVVVGSGACVVDWDSLEILTLRYLPATVASRVANELISHEESFFLLHDPPASHLCSIYLGAHDGHSGDFRRRMEIYKSDSVPLDLKGIEDGSAHFAQFLVIKDKETLPPLKAKIEELCQSSDDVRFVVLTSPGDGKSQWLEILPKTTSKGAALVALAEELLEHSPSPSSNAPPMKVYAVGNDTNDLDMLKTAAGEGVSLPISTVAGGAFMVGDSSAALQEAGHGIPKLDGSCSDGCVAALLDRVLEESKQ